MIKRLSKFLLVFVLITGWIFSGWPGIQIAEAVSAETFTASTTWTAPTGVTSVTAEVWGGGGGGGGQNQNSDGGGGGGGGAYSQQTAITVTPGNGYTVTVGAAGGGVASSCGGTGGDSSFVDTATVLAKGGVGGCPSTGTPPAGGAGGAAASGVGTTKFSGGQGEKGRNNNTGQGGYGGSSAGTAAAGFSGPQTWSTVTYPTASTPTGGGHGGNGGGAGANGSAPASGNGGGGGGSGDGTALVGGNGAVGKVILTYNKPPNAPSQDSPADAATGVSVTPTFLMTATDADTTVDNLSYKVTIYSNSACTTVVQTNDQAVSSTGWTGSDATCTAAPTACYLSGTQGSYLTQSALSNSTQYWWKASAKDPDGNGTFTDSSTCNTFTTAASQTLTFSLGVTSLNLGTLSASAVTSGSHTMNVATNAASGMAVTVSGATLTSGANTITACAACTDAGGAGQGTKQFGINLVANTSPTVGAAASGTPTIGVAATNYNTANSFRFVTGETIASSTGAINDTTFTISYIANISNVTAAGSYTTTLTYVATATF